MSSREPGPEPAFPTISTERLSLRLFDPARPSDYDALLALYDSDIVKRTLGNPGVYTREDIDLRAKRFHPRPKDWDSEKRGPFPSHAWHFIYLRDGTDIDTDAPQGQGQGQAVGCISLAHRHPLPYPDLGYTVMEPYVNRGYATEAAKAALRWWSDEMGVENIWAAAFDTNVVSQRVARKIGFVDGGEVTVLLDDAVVKQGKAFVQPGMGRCLDGLTVDVRQK
ncbi:uncharacterized protein Z520_05473 [Fonsecaea multimorphosa CBS 102226]|uniref:N-acetyltransferase domain-containing protein n=1 Tax=Fonsecaea multimorphosa CBS 102226 TaxID=1442371 RepID=A0A0D2JZS2_9EURO|nr:uncharacterized protein Z520_05473 [Fonsecaea multimorphosa CBS 102226]KIX99012.1 hypothetical protein Z520_05473 [Fonsecaea multimorphosa CBS 102226]OAL25281.1 hypothetical protein AYO22_05158 [Fonsecaea multimorphosa]